VALVQYLIVAALVVASLSLSAWWLTPLRQRLWLLDHLTRAGARQGALARLRRALLARAPVGCQACPANPSANARGSTEKGAALRR
jgi:hypothetical protein